MNIRLYYDDNGRITGVMLIDPSDWNLLEVNSKVDSDDNQITFPLTEENLNEVMDGPHEVNLDCDIIVKDMMEN